MSPPPKEQLKILFATPECAPLVKTGGLGDVSAALPPALLARGIDVRMLLPGYPAVTAAHPKAAEIATFPVLGHTVRLLDARLESGVPLAILDCPQLYARGGGPYQADDGEDWEDNALRFGVLSRCAAILGTGASPWQWRPDVVHCHDWPTALAPVYLSRWERPRAGSLLTIHNLAFQGKFDFGEAHPLDLPPEVRGTEGVEFFGRMSFLKGGLMFADAINTVSPTYAKEIQGEALGFGMEGVLRHRSAVLHGVLNGIDTALWDPQSDPLIASNYGVLTLDRKAANKRLLRKKMLLKGDDSTFLLAIVSRLTHQKGIDLIAQAASEIVKMGAQIAIVGTGDKDMADRVLAAKRQNPGNVGVHIGFDEALAHLVEAGADAFLMPSRFEPCGMNQMYSQRYGTPPIVYPTGGLADTVNATTGFFMHELSAAGLVEAVERALAAYRQARPWRDLQNHGMTRDFGWGRAAAAYEHIYESIRPIS